MNIILQRSVGRNSSNLLRDVMLVQQLLNHQLAFMASRTRLNVTGQCDSATMDAIGAYQRAELRMIEPTGCVDPGSQTLRQLLFWTAGSRNFAHVIRAAQALQSPSFGPIVPVNIVAPGGGKNQKYTNDPQEVEMTTTTPSPRELSNLLLQLWPELTIDGAHTLVAQYMHETGNGIHCHNWNLGNVKAPLRNTPHMYLRGTWEPLPEEKARVKIAGSGGLARAATEAENKKHGWSHGMGEIVVVCTPPDPYSRFRAYSSLAEGAVKWTDRYKGKAIKHPELLPALNRGDCAMFAKLLKLDHYYLGLESDYANNMSKIKKEIDLQLGMK